MRQKLGEMLIEAGAIDELQLKSALADQRRWGRPLGRTLVEMRLIREEDLVRVLAKQLGLQPVDLDRQEIPQNVIALIPAHLAKAQNVIPFNAPMKFIDIAMLDPTNLGVIDEIRIRTQLNPRTYLAGPKMIERALEKYYGASNPVEYEIPLDDTPHPEDVSIPATDARDGLRTYQRRPASIGLDSGISINAHDLARDSRDREIEALQARLSALEAMVERDETVLRKLLSLLIEKGIATRDEIVERLG
jgi:type IV pilus assembly protein PilB